MEKVKLEFAISEINESASKNFKEALDVAVNLGIDPKKTDQAPPEETDRFAQYSNTDLMSEMLKRTDQGERRNSTLHIALIAEIIARSNDHRLEQKRAMYRSFLQ